MSDNAVTTKQDERLLTVADVQERLSVSRDTVGRLIASGDLTPVRIGRAVRIANADVDEFIARCKPPNN